MISNWEEKQYVKLSNIVKGFSHLYCDIDLNDVISLSQSIVDLLINNKVFQSRQKVWYFIFFLYFFLFISCSFAFTFLSCGDFSFIYIASFILIVVFFWCWYLWTVVKSRRTEIWMVISWARSLKRNIYIDTVAFL